MEQVQRRQGIFLTELWSGWNGRNSRELRSAGDGSSVEEECAELVLLYKDSIAWFGQLLEELIQIASG